MSKAARLVRVGVPTWRYGNPFPHDLVEIDGRAVYVDHPRRPVGSDR